MSETINLCVPGTDITVFEPDVVWQYAVTDANNQPVDLSTYSIVAWAVLVGSTDAILATVTRTDDANGQGTITWNLEGGKSYQVFCELRPVSGPPLTILASHLSVRSKPGRPA